EAQDSCTRSFAFAQDDVGNRLREKTPILLPRFTRLLDAHDRAVLPPHRPPPLAVDHVSSRVTRSGAKEPTTSSCPSREQTTPGDGRGAQAAARLRSRCARGSGGRVGRSALAA